MSAMYVFCMDANNDPASSLNNHARGVSHSTSTSASGVNDDGSCPDASMLAINSIPRFNAVDFRDIVEEPRQKIHMFE